MCEGLRTMIDTTNKFLVSSCAGRFQYQQSVRTGCLDATFTSAPISADDALIFAAWLVALAEPNASHTFAEVLEAVRAT